MKSLRADTARAIFSSFPFIPRSLGIPALLRASHWVARGDLGYLRSADQHELVPKLRKALSRLHAREVSPPSAQKIAQILFSLQGAANRDPDSYESDMQRAVEFLGNSEGVDLKEEFETLFSYLTCVTSESNMDRLNVPLMATCVWRFLHLREQLTWGDDKQTSIPPWPVMHVARRSAAILGNWPLYFDTFSHDLVEHEKKNAPFLAGFNDLNLGNSPIELSLASPQSFVSTNESELRKFAPPKPTELKVETSPEFEVFARCESLDAGLPGVEDDIKKGLTSQFGKLKVDAIGGIIRSPGVSTRHLYGAFTHGESLLLSGQTFRGFDITDKGMDIPPVRTLIDRELNEHEKNDPRKVAEMHKMRLETVKKSNARPHMCRVFEKMNLQKTEKGYAGQFHHDTRWIKTREGEECPEILENIRLKTVWKVELRGKHLETEPRSWEKIKMRK